MSHDVLFLNKPLSVDELKQTVRMLNQSWKAREKSKVLEMQMVSHAKMAALGNMAVRIGHEINQPLSYINGMLQLQKMGMESGQEIDLEQCTGEIDLALEQTVRIKEIIALVSQRLIEQIQLVIHNGRNFSKSPCACG